MIKGAIRKVVEGHNLTREEAGIAMDTIMRGDATPSQIAAFITALHTKGESVDEITGFAEKMREHAIKIFPRSDNLVDTCGTGGDHAGTFNISTIAAFIAAGAGVAVAKHGNRSITSRCGSADLLEALGIKVDIEPKLVEECINQVGIGFIFAPNFHKAMRFAAPTRREIGISTVFNILGPLSNPANASVQVLGVFHEELTEVMAAVLKNLGTKRALVVHGNDGLDELSVCEKTRVTELHGGDLKTYFVKPEDFGILRVGAEELRGGDAAANAEIAIRLLNNEEKGAKREIVLLNAGAAIYVGGLAGGLKEGIDKAAESLASGAAINKLEELVRFTSRQKN
ncbi:anthranilate phosphoribosyltransferase [candidate division WOR-1 bacterium RIFOXYA12_FULL_52_29]|uniref:Anthranilate phosphoribosyltransferase n=1 Tax=candidate division WOR-1 bacterium RIFOXYC12_FULL_54_18 TaxID=1802584 RepID=A0A1F4T5W7_UNCSA|nr:MAG: anthranilate phosphoribosyltransferase [candidate division WOR-1 bacterium RIFOXYA2_FULL_51_19]OGC17768.1 MAG: anthranilate phosphoribosyltransferase [candidate division WOR-1 bacterium RIFOXYA12_FULL_52_29]OGC26625.1 MAG: anthranilate phosphoribosyltransferase [candidate division WOR-1 bacterium RIFOXYB2_FULL_45_9]OGC28185.1 MAG: anthranilate phosphoribosyltransferase [candidate division WOR-1 bacterium RIFOXYC12_FULL_54_18]OGC29528.1 MAG: anthranilate phosphoribosyltransferase [candid